MGILDLPGPLFAAIDSLMAALMPAGARLVIWAIMAGAGTLLLYRLISPQARIGQAKRDAREARRRLNEFDGEFAEAGPLIRGQFSAAFRHLGLVLIPTLLSMLPLLALLTWIDHTYSYDFPDRDDPPVMMVEPEPDFAEWIADSDIPLVRIGVAGSELVEIALTAPIPVIERRQWWNWLVANPLGYLSGETGLERVSIDLPQRAYLPFGPPWMRSWLAILLPTMVLVSLLTYRWARVE
ncbi:hypothetical protein MCB86_15285 [Pseudomonas sp. KSR10]|jgi:hypothetical protein|uniref:Uncharacterized protein n=1 Tax=Stutzerimonas stutzeri TaxID=316 RepID=A0A0D9AGG9_STUST|nr:MULTISPECIES: hypothetical protein [Pseudomonadaceae]KJH79807.1 hypothetical protein UF78_21985 [Stutzerimonas stutzeri]MCG6541440.1 hypothetical protein [Pseudomonas sp. KSR10]